MVLSPPCRKRKISETSRVALALFGARACPARSRRQAEAHAENAGSTQPEEIAADEAVTETRLGHDWSPMYSRLRLQRS